jgi:hypothetical protein
VTQRQSEASPSLIATTLSTHRLSLRFVGVLGDVRVSFWVAAIAIVALRGSEDALRTLANFSDCLKFVCALLMVERPHYGFAMRHSKLAKTLIMCKRMACLRSIDECMFVDASNIQTLG